MKAYSEAPILEEVTQFFCLIFPKTETKHLHIIVVFVVDILG